MPSIDWTKPLDRDKLPDPFARRARQPKPTTTTEAPSKGATVALEDPGSDPGPDEGHEASKGDGGGSG